MGNECWDAPPREHYGYVEPVPVRCPFCGSEEVINGGTMRRCIECGEPWLAGDEGVLDPNPPAPTSIEEDT